MSSSHAEWVEFINDTSVSIKYDDNVNLSAFSSDTESDLSINPRYTFGRFYQVDDLTRLRLSLNLSAIKFKEFNDLSSVDAVGSAVIRHKFGIGFNKPWIRGEVSAGIKEAKVDERDSNLYALGLSAGKRITDRLSGQIDLKYDKRDGGAGPEGAPGVSRQVFDLENTSLSLGLDYLLDERSQVSANVTHRTGEFDSACTPENVNIVLANENINAIILDEVFGGCAYQVDGSSNALKLQYSYALGRHSSLNVGYEVREGEADVLDYDSSLWNASFMYSK